MLEREILHSLDRLTYRPERSRPVYRNVHTGKVAVVIDMGVDDNGGFQGGCRRYTVTTDEPGPPGPPDPPSSRRRAGMTYSLDSFIRNWEPTGERTDAP